MDDDGLVIELRLYPLVEAEPILDADERLIGVRIRPLLPKHRSTADFAVVSTGEGRRQCLGLNAARDQLKLNYVFWAMRPTEAFEQVKRMLAEPDLADDPAGGLNPTLPPKAFLK